MDNINSHIRKKERENDDDDDELFEEEKDEEEEEEEDEYENYNGNVLGEDVEFNNFKDELLLISPLLIDINLLTKKKLIGEGSEFYVYKTKNKKTNQLIASKIAKDEYFIDETKHINLYINFKHELTILSQISHPFIAKFNGYSPYDFYHRKRGIIFLDYYKNGSLEKILELERCHICIHATSFIEI